MENTTKREGELIKIIHKCIRFFDTMTSADGSGHHDLAEVIESDLKRYIKERHATKLEIVSGDNSRDFWAEINAIDAMSTGDDLHAVLYSTGCKMQELESEINKLRNAV